MFDESLLTKTLLFKYIFESLTPIKFFSILGGLLKSFASICVF